MYGVLQWSGLKPLTFFTWHPNQIWLSKEFKASISESSSIDFPGIWSTLLPWGVLKLEQAVPQATTQRSLVYPRCESCSWLTPASATFLTGPLQLPTNSQEIHEINSLHNSIWQASLNWPTGSEAHKGSSIHTVSLRRGAQSLAYSRKPHQRCWELPETTLHRTIITNAPAASYIWSSSAKGKHIWWRICASLCFPPAPSERSTLTPLVWTMDTLLDTERAWSWLPDCVLCILAGALCSRNRLMTKCHNSKQLAYNRVDSL